MTSRMSSSCSRMDKATAAHSSVDRQMLEGWVRITYWLDRVWWSCTWEGPQTHQYWIKKYILQGFSHFKRCVEQYEMLRTFFSKHYEFWFVILCKLSSSKLEEIKLKYFTTSFTFSSGWQQILYWSFSSDSCRSSVKALKDLWMLAVSFQGKM